MEGRGGGRKPFEVWDHVTKLGGNRVKCKRCDFEFSAPSATRIKSHLYSTPKQGIRGCPNFDGAAGCSSERRGKNIERSDNHEIELMNLNLDSAVLPNESSENVNKRKEIAVEKENKQPKIQRHVRKMSEDEIAGEESRSRPILVPMPLRRTSIWHAIELQVADLEEKLHASVARERKLDEELADLKEKYEHDITALTKEHEELSRLLMNEIFVRESKLKEAKSSLSIAQEQLSHAGEKLEASKKKNADIVDVREAEKASQEISLRGAQLSHVKEKWNSFQKEKGNLFASLKEAKQGSSNIALKLVSFLEEDNQEFISLDNPFEFDSTNEQGFESFQLSSKTLGEQDIINTNSFWKMFYGTRH